MEAFSFRPLNYYDPCENGENMILGVCICTFSTVCMSMKSESKSDRCRWWSKRARGQKAPPASLVSPLPLPRGKVEWSAGLRARASVALAQHISKHQNLSFTQQEDDVNVNSSFSVSSVNSTCPWPRGCISTYMSFKVINISLITAVLGTSDSMKKF